MAKSDRHRKVLRKCGFSKQPGGKEEKWILFLGDTFVTWTSVPNGRGELKTGTFRQILKQMKLTEDEYGPFYACRERLTEYRQILVRKEIISAEAG